MTVMAVTYSGVVGHALIWLTIIISLYCIVCKKEKRRPTHLLSVCACVIIEATMKSPGSSLSGGKDYLEEEKWEKMGTKTSVVSEFMDKVNRRVNSGIFTFDEDQIRVMWLSTTLFFTVGGYWLLRSLKDPIISIIDGVDRIPQAKILSLFVVLFLVVICKSIARYLLEVMCHPVHVYFHVVASVCNFDIFHDSDISPVSFFSCMCASRNPSLQITNWSISCLSIICSTPWGASMRSSSR